MDSINDILRQSRQLVENIHKGEGDKLVPLPSSDIFRQSLLVFLQSRMQDARNGISIIDIIDSELVRKVALKEMSPTELLTYRKVVQEAVNMTTTSILEPFKPSSNTGSTLLSTPKDDSGSAGLITDQLTAEQRTALNKLEQFMQIVATKVSTKDEGED